MSFKEAHITLIKIDIFSLFNIDNFNPRAHTRAKRADKATLPLKHACTSYLGVISITRIITQIITNRWRTGDQ